MARITMRKTQETKLSEIFTLHLASAAARGIKEKTLRTYEQHFNAISKRLDVDGNISLITSKDLDKMILRMRDFHFFQKQEGIGIGDSNYHRSRVYQKIGN